MADMIRVGHLSKSFGTVRAVKDLSFAVESGTVFAFLGTNGAGKSTTISCLTTVSSADEGTIEIAGLTVGRDDDAIRRKIGVVFQTSLLDPTLTVRENLADRAAVYGMAGPRRAERIRELAEMIDLGDFLDRRYGMLSGGQMRRADIARALMHEPVLLFLDEPTAGLDPQSREQVWDTIHTLRETQGLTVFLTTHYMEETEEADQISIIHLGELVVQGTPAELRKTYSSSTLAITSSAPDDLHGACERAGLAVTFAAGTARIAVESSAQALEFLKDNKHLVDDFELRHGTMDDVFLAVTANRGAK
jgi:multidrug/hemolysin transport system ATP-binding protein